MQHGEMDEFWARLEALRAAKADPDKPEPFRRRLADALKPLDAHDIARFIGGYRLADHALDTQATWWAVCLLRGEICEGADFADARAWIIGHGRVAWSSVCDDPDVLADWPLPTDKSGAPVPALAPLVATPWKALEKRIDDEPERMEALHAATQPAALPDDCGIDVGWRYWPVPTAAALASAMPRLWALHGARWQDDPDPRILREHPREVDVPRLGRVRLGDTLVRRDGSTFTVLGLHDGDAMMTARGFLPCDHADGSFIARIREEDGRTSCSQGLGRAWQRWPHEPDSVFPDDEPYVDGDGIQAAWQERDEAIQARVQAALADDGEVRVVFSAYDEDDAGLPLDNLDAVAHKGDIRFVETDDSDGQRWEGDVLTDPTWLDVARAANRAIVALGYRDHVYLEGLKVTKRPRGQAAVARFVFGS
jgi:hypothetical protein